MHSEAQAVAIASRCNVHCSVLIALPACHSYLQLNALPSFSDEVINPFFLGACNDLILVDTMTCCRDEEERLRSEKLEADLFARAQHENEEKTRQKELEAKLLREKAALVSLGLQIMQFASHGPRMSVIVN